MNRVGNWLKSRTVICVLSILIIGLLLRGYNIVDRYYYAHDGDLYSWVVKDIVIDHHLRLIGQLTSSQGIFIGPLFYYAIIPFYLLTAMDPVGALIFALILSVFTMYSYFYVFKSLFDTVAGLLAVFLQSVLFSRVGYDIWIVPTVTTSLWEIWYFYVIVMLVRGNFTVLPILAVLVALIWHINFSLAPILIAVPVAILLSKKVPKLVQCIKSFLIFIVLSVPLFAFEIRHNFIQVRSFIDSFLIDQGGGRGVEKFWHVLQQATGNIVGLFFYPTRDIFIPNITLLGLVFLFALLLVRKKILDGRILIVLFVWIFSMIGFFTFSSKMISEYYFSNLNVVFLGLVTLGLSALFKNSLIGKVLSLSVLGYFLFFSTNYILTHNEDNLMGYPARKAVASFIAEDAKKRGLPCVALSYITVPGENVGFRYFFYLNKTHVIHPSSDNPAYTIVVPYGLAEKSITAKFGAIGVITPEEKGEKEKIAESCSGDNTNLTDSLFGYTD